jgi:sugar lactone lactonase YvrE
MRLSCLTVAIAAMFASQAVAHPGSGIAVDRFGNVYFLDTGSGLWKIDAQQRVTKLSDSRFHWLALDEDRRFAGSKLPASSGGEIEAVGRNPTVLISSDYPIALGANSILRRTGSNGIAAGPNGSFLYTDNQSIYTVASDGKATVFATVARLPGAKLVPGNALGDGPLLRGLAIGDDGSIVVAASGDGRVLRISSDGQVSTLLTVESPWAPTAVALHSRDIYVLEYLHTAIESREAWLPRVRKIAPDGKSSILASIVNMPGARRRNR